MKQDGGMDLVLTLLQKKQFCEWNQNYSSIHIQKIWEITKRA